MPVDNLIRFRQGSSSEWDNIDPILATGEPGWDTTNNLLKIGDGNTVWSELINTAEYGLLAVDNLQLDNNILSSTSGNIFIIPSGGLTVASGSLITTSGLVDQLVFNTSLDDPDLLVGQLQWNSTEGTLDLGLNDSYSMHLGEEMLYRVRNITGSTLLAGQPVYASGLSPGGNNRIEVNLYAANGSIREIRFMGLMTQDLTDNGNNGYATHFGYIRGVDTRGDAAINGTTNKLWTTNEPQWNEGDILYVHPTVPGKLTKTEPKHSISVAIVTNVASNGKLFVRPTSYGHLDDNHDVAVSGATNGQFLQYNSVTDYWVPSSSGNFTNLTINNSGIPVGTGVSDFVARWTSDNILSTGIIYDNGTNVGIGTSSPASTLEVEGSFSATTKSFVIKHPSNPDMKLQYGSLESPYHGIRLTGKNKLKNGVCEIKLPEYIKDLVSKEDINFQITNYKHHKILYVDKIDLDNNKVVIKGYRCKSLGELEFFWSFTGIRKDVEPLIVEY